MFTLKNLLKRNFCSKNSNIVRIDYNKLMCQTTDLSEEIEKAYSLKGVGISVITNIPKYSELRTKVLTSGYKLSQESDELKKSISKPHCHNAIGFDNIPFITKGDKVNQMFCSFTARNLRETVVYPDHPQMEKDHSNIWPETPNLPNFKQNFLSLGGIINTCQANLLRHISNYITKIDPSFKDKLNKDLGETKNHDSYGRLISYFPPENYFHEREGDKYIWDDWHTDYSLLTALTHPIYFNKEGKIAESKFSSLSIKDRLGNPVEAMYEENELVIQCSDAMFILSGGHILATPHSVRINKKMPLNLYRINLATFFQPNYNYVMNIPKEETFSDLIKKDPTKFEYKNAAFQNGMDFGKYFETSLDYLLNRK